MRMFIVQIEAGQSCLDETASHTHTMCRYTVCRYTVYRVTYICSRYSCACCLAGIVSALQLAQHLLLPATSARGNWLVSICRLRSQTCDHCKHLEYGQVAAGCGTRQWVKARNNRTPVVQASRGVHHPTLLTIGNICRQRPCEANT